MSNPAKPNQATIVKTLKKGGLELLGKYVNNKTPLKCRCKKCGKIVYPKYNTITQGGGGCKPCGYKKIANQLRLSQAEIMKRLKEKNLELISPKTVTSIEQKIKVKCLICETKQFKTVHQLKHNTGCSKCGHKKGGEKLKTIESVAIEVMRNSGFEPLEKFVRSNSPWKCRCKKCGNTSAPSFKTVKNTGTKCAFCAGLRITDEEAISDMSKSNLTPLEPYKNTHARWKSQCNNCEKIVYISHSKAKNRKQKCRYCAEFRPYLDSSEMEKIIESYGFKLLEPFTKKKQSLKALHIKCGKKTNIYYGSIRRGIGMCKWCSNNRPIDQKEAVRIMKKSGYIPQVKFTSGKAKWKSIHKKCGNLVTPTFQQIREGGGGCRYCASWGFSYSDVANVYLITHPVLLAHKIGISNPRAKVSDDRIYKHRKNGWHVHKVWTFPNGKIAEQIETRFLQIVRKDLKLPPFLSKEEMPVDGYTETFSADGISIITAEKIVRKVIKELSVD
jgi:hypothetical protein